MKENTGTVDIYEDLRMTLYLIYQRIFFSIPKRQTKVAVIFDCMGEIIKYKKMLVRITIKTQL